MIKVIRLFCFHQKSVPVRTCTKWLYAHALGLFSNDDPGLTLTIFMTGSNLFPDPSVLLYSLYSIECSCISKFVLIQQILSTWVSDTGPRVVWFLYLPGPVARLDAHPTGIQEVAGWILWSNNILSWRFVME